ncbi:MAG: hypothetical protein ABWY82_14375 [Tardiphaga sp.]
MNSRTDYSAAVLECFETLDVALMRKLWRHIRPDLPQPDDDAETLATLHMARTECNAVKPRSRMYSHAWLRERGLPSQLPDAMRASAERMFPIVVRAVGISYNTRSPLLREIVTPIREAMGDAVLEIHADDHNLGDDDLVKRHMREAKERTVRKLLGRVRS